MTCKNVCDIKESHGRRSRRASLTCKVPQDDLAAIYLNKKAPTSDGTVLDESKWNEYKEYGVFDGATYAVGGTDSIHNGNYFPFEYLFYQGALTAAGTLAAKAVYGNNVIEPIIRIKNGYLSFYFTPDTILNKEEWIDTVNLMPAEQWNHIIGNFNNGVLSGTINGVAFSHTFTATTIALTSSRLELGKWGGAGSNNDLFTGQIAYAKCGAAEFNFQNFQGTDTIENIGVGDDATLTGATLDEFWANSNAQLVQSACGTFDGATYVRVNDKILVYTVSSLVFKVWLQGTNKASELCVIAQSNSVNDRSFGVVTTTAGKLRVYCSANGTSWETFITSATDIMDGDWHYIEFTWTLAGGVELKIDNTIDAHIGSAPTSLHLSDAYFEIARFFSSYIWIGKMAGLEIGNDKFNIASGGIAEELQNTGTGGNAVLTGATLDDFWGSTQDVYHYNILNGFDLWTNGTEAQNIRVPIGTTVTQSGYTFVSSNPAGIWHNNAESFIQLPNSLSDVQDDTPISSITDNKYLEWVDGEIRNMRQRYESGTSTISEVANGTRFNFPDSDNSYLAFKSTVTAGKTYNYYVKVESVAYGRILLDIGSGNITISSVGVVSGAYTTTTDAVFVSLKRTIACDLIISKLYVWEEGTVPPLSYREMETNFNDKDQVFSSMIKDKHKHLVTYNEQVTEVDDLLKLDKCLKVKNSEFVLTDDDGVVLTDDDGILLVGE